MQPMKMKVVYLTCLVALIYGAKKHRERGIRNWTNWKHAAHADRYRYCYRSWDLVSFLYALNPQ
jgi:hypothetical protein